MDEVVEKRTGGRPRGVVVAHPRVPIGHLRPRTYPVVHLLRPSLDVGVGLRSSADGSTIWDVAEPRTTEHMWRLEVGDITGDGISELSLLHSPSIWGMVPQELYLLNGATGAMLQNLSDERIMPLRGDADGDGDRDEAHT